MSPSSHLTHPETRYRRPVILATSVAALMCLFSRPASAQTWVGQIAVPSGSWNDVSNWNPATVPNGPTATATFGTSSTTNISLLTSIQLGSLTFSANATTPYLFTNGASFTFSGAGIANNSGGFNDYFDNLGGASTTFSNHSTAGFFTFFTNEGASSADGSTGSLFFNDTSTASGATIINQGGTVSGAVGGATVFSSGSTAGTATIISNGGVGFGGATFFEQTASGSTATAMTNGNGVFDISGLTNTGMSIGSIAGSGTYNLGSRTLTVGGNSATTAVSGTIADGGKFGGMGGSLVKTGTGILTLAAMNTYTGTTLISGGTLQVNGAIQSTAAVTVNSGGTLAGTGTIAGPVTVNSGGILAHSNSNTPGTITLGGLTLNSGSKVDYELSTPGTSGGGVNDLTVVNGNLTLGGTLNLTELSGFGAGTYELFTYTGTLTGSTLSLGSLPPGIPASDFTIQTSVAHEVNLIVSAGPSVQYWDGSVTSANNAVNGGSGVWNNGTTNWTNVTGTTNTSWGQSVAIFGTGFGLVSVVSNVTAGELRFAAGSGPYTFSISTRETLTINGAGITNASTNAPTFTMSVDNGGGSGGMQFTNAATAGNANITTPGAIGVGLGGGSVQFNNTSSAGSATITNSAGAIEDGGGGTTSFVNGSTAGHSQILNVGAGSPLDTDPTDVIYDGNGQTLFANTSSAGTASITNQGSSIAMSIGGATTFSDNATAAGATISNETGADNTSNGSTLFLGNSTAGNATIINHGSAVGGDFGGNVTFGANSTAGNATIINGGASSGVGGSTDFVGNATAGNATIQNQGGTGGGGATYFLNNSDGGTATVITNGNGVFDISGLTSRGMNIGSISGSGTYSLGSKTLTVGGNNLSTTVSGTIADGGLFGGFGGSLVKTGAGTLTLSGTNTYTGTTVVNSGALQVNGSLSVLSSVTVNTSGTLGGTGTIAGPVTINAGGTLTHGASGSAATLTLGSLTLNGGSFVDYQLGTPGTPGGGVNDLTIVNGSLTLGGTLDVTGLTGFGPGTYELFSYTGNLTGTGALSIGTVPAGFVAQDFTLQTSTAGQVDLVVTGPLYWNGAVTTADGTVHGGTGNWDNVTTNWTDPTGASSSTWKGVNGVFSGTAGTVTLTDNINVAALEFSTAGYTINASGAFGLNVNGGATIATDTNANATINAPIQGNGTLQVSGAANLTLSGALTDHGGSLAFTQNSSGVTILLNAGNTYSGPTTVNNGTLQIGSGAIVGSIGSGAVGVNSGGILAIVNLGVNPGGVTFANSISNGVGGVGTVDIASPNMNILSGALTDGAAGTLALTQSGTGTTTLTNAGNTYSGATTVMGGTLQIGSATAPGSIGAASAVNVSSGTLSLVNVSGNTFSNAVSGSGTLNINSANPLTISGQLTDELSVAVSGGTGILTNGNNNFSGAITVSNSGTLQIGTATTAGSIGLGAVSVSNGGTFTVVNLGGAGLTNSFSNGVGGTGTVVVNSTQNVNFLNSLKDGAAGVLALVQSGSGTTTLQNSQSDYSGGTVVNSGVLKVDNLSGSGTGTGAVLVNGGALTGTGTISGNVTLAGGSLVPGSIPFTGTITVGGLTLISGTADFRLASPTGNSNDLVDVMHNLTLGGTLNIETQSGFTTGTYTLFDYGGALNGSFSSITGLTGYNSSIVTTTAGVVQLVITSMGMVQFWDGNGVANDNIVSGGSGSWSTTGTNWTTSSGSSNSTWQSGTAVFGAPGGTVTLTSPISAQVLLFNHGGYTLAGSQTLTMIGTAPAIDVTNAGDIATIGVRIAGTSGLAMGGQGTVVLTNTGNNFTGTTTVNGATLQIGNVTAAGSLGAGNVVLQNGGTLSLENLTATTFANNISSGLGGGTLQTTFLKNFTLSGALTDGPSSQLAVDITLGGTITLANSGNTYSGQTTVSQSTLQVGTATVVGSIGASSPVQVHQGGTLTLVNVAGNTLANNISNSGGNTGAVVVNSAKNLTLSGAITDTNGTGLGNITLSQSGTGTTILTGTDTYTGATTVTAGALQIGNGATGNLTASNVAVSNTASVILDQADGSSSNINVNLSASGTSLQAIQSGHLTLGGVISGAGVVNQNGTGTTEFQAAETYTSATNINAGTLQVDTSLAAGSTVHVGTNGTLSGAGTIHGNVTLTGNGNIDLTGGAINGTLAVTGGNWTGTGTVMQLITSSAGTFTIGNGASLTAMSGLNVTSGTLAGTGGTLVGNLNYTSSFSSTFGGVIAGTDTLTLNNALATLDLTGANTYTGVTTVTAGTLQVDGSLASGTAVNVLGAAALSGAGTINGNVNVTGNGIIDLGSTGQIDGVVLASGARWMGLGSAASVTSNSGAFALSGSLTTNTLTINGGTLSGNGALNGSLVYNSTSSSTFGGLISTGIAMTGNGATLTLTGASTVTGAVTASAGTLQIGNGTSGNLNASSISLTNSAILATDLANNATFTPDVSLGGNTSALNAIQAGTNTLSGVISGIGFINQKGTGTTILNNTETYTGSTSVSAGTLQIGDGTNGNLIGTSGVVVTASCALALNLSDMSSFTPTVALNATGAALKAIQSGQVDILGVISGTGAVDQNGTGTTILDAAETYTGATNVNAGDLAVNGSLVAGSTVNIGTLGELTGTAGTISGKVTLTGNGRIDFDNSTIGGTLTVTGGTWLGMGTVNGLVTSSSGNFTIGALSTLVAPAGVSVTGGTFSGTGQLTGSLAYTSSATSTFGGVIADGAAASKLTMNKAASTLVLTGANTYTGATTVTAGTLQLGDGVTTGTALGNTAITVSGTGVLALDLPSTSTFGSNVSLTAAGATVKAIQSGVTTLSGTLGGTGGLNQSGAGTTIVFAAQNYTGVTSVNAGTLQIDSSLLAASTVNVAATGTLDGTGTVPGTVNVLVGGTLGAGDSTDPGTLTVGKLVLNAGSNSTFRLAAPGTVGQGVNDLVQVTGNLTIAGNLNVTALTGFGVGSYTLFTYGGTLAGTGFSGINGTAGYTVSVVTGVAHQVSLQVVAMGVTTQYWDGTGAINNNNIAGGSGTWNNTTTNWTNSSGSTNSAWLGGEAVFNAPGGTVTLAAPINSQGLSFGSTGYTLTGSSPLNLVGTSMAPPIISVTNAGTTATIGVPITGNSGLSANGAGTLILTSMTNSYTGRTNITTGFVQIGTTAASGSIGGGTISIGNSGTLTLVNVHGNLLANNVSDAIGGVGTLTVNASTSNTLSGALTNGVGQISLNQIGTGTTTLTNAGNTFTGATTISKGTLQIGTSTAPGSLNPSSAVSVAGGSTLSLVNAAGNSFGNDVSDSTTGTGLVSINTTTSMTLGGALTNGSGTLALTKVGTGTAILVGADSYAGVTTVGAGTLQFGNGTSGALTGAGAITLSGTGTVALDLPDASTISRTISLGASTTMLKGLEAAGTTNTLSGVISGTGGFTQAGPGTTVMGLNVAELYTGATNIIGGVLAVDGSLAAGSTVNVGTGGMLTGSGQIKGKVTLSGNGVIEFNGINGVNFFIGNLAQTLTVNGGTWEGTGGSVTGVVTSSSGVFTIASGSTLIAAAGVNVTGGTIVGADATANLNGSLTDTSSTNDTFGGAITGTNSVVTMNKAGSTLTLTGANTYGKGTTITAGTIQVGDGTTTGATLGTGVVTTAAAGTLTTDLASGETFGNAVVDNGRVVATGTTNNYTVSSAISGTGNLTKTGTNSVALTAANTYKGGTIVSGGTLAVDNTTGSGTGAGPVTINIGGTLGGSGTISGATTLNTGGTLFPSASTPGVAGTTLRASSLLWNSGGTLTLQLSDTADDALALSGALTKGSAGTYTLDLLNAGLISTKTYNLTLLTFASTNFTAANFNLELPLNYTGQLVLTGTSLEIENLTDPPPAMHQQSQHAELPATGITSSEIGTPSALAMTPTPEPGSALLLAFGGAGLLGWRRRRGSLLL